MTTGPSLQLRQQREIPDILSPTYAFSQYLRDVDWEMIPLLLSAIAAELAERGYCGAAEHIEQEAEILSMRAT